MASRISHGASKRQNWSEWEAYLLVVAIEITTVVLQKLKSSPDQMNKPSPHSVFQEPYDHYNWDKYLEQLDLIELSRSDKKRVKAALFFLRSLFGENFLKRCFRTGHPLRYEFTNSAPMARLSLMRFSESLRIMDLRSEPIRILSLATSKSYMWTDLRL